MRVTAKPSDLNQAISGSGSLATFASRMTLPFASTTQTLALSNDTSIPAYCSMVVPPMMLGAGTSPTPLRHHHSQGRPPATPALAQGHARYPIYQFVVI